MVKKKAPKKAAKKKTKKKPSKPTSRHQQLFNGLDAYGERMIKCMLWATETYIYGKPNLTVINHWKEIIDHEFGPYNELGGSAEDWNKAIGFVKSWWGSGGNVYPVLDEDGYAEVFWEKTSSSYDEGFEFTAYNAQGQEVEISIKEIDIQVSKWPKTTFDQWEAAEPARIAAEKAKKAKAAAKKKAALEKKAKLKEQALSKLSDEERKALGVK